MGIRTSAFCLTLIAALFAADANAAGTCSNLTGDKAQLTLSPDQISALPIDVQAMAESRCGPSAPGGSVNHCRLTVGTAGPKTGVPRPLCIVSDKVPGEEFPFVPMQATTLDLVGTAPVRSSCGNWDASLSLEDDEQPASSMILQPASDFGGGLFAGLLVARVSLYLTNQRTLETFEGSLVLGISLTGRWFMESRTAPTLDDLFSFSDSPESGCFPVWILEASEQLEPFVEKGRCQICIDRYQPQP